MKSLKRFFATMALVVVATTAMAHPMSHAAMRNNARFLTDRMAYTLGLSAALIDDLYYINYDYICGVNDYLDDVALGYYYDDYMAVVRERDYALQRILTPAQWTLLLGYDYFYRPISFVNRAWRFAIYAFDHRPNYFYYRTPRYFNSYRGGHHFHGMRPARHHARPAHRPSFRLEPHRVGHVKNGIHNEHRPEGGKIDRPGNGGRPNGGNVNRPGNGGTNGRPSGTPNVGGSDRPSNDNNQGVRPGNSGGRNNGSVTGNTGRNRGDRVAGSNRGGRSESNMRSSSRAGNTRSSFSTGRSSSGSRSSVNRSTGSSSRSSGATRGGGSSRSGRR